MKQSAGLLMFKWEDKILYFFLVHPGGPFFARKNEGTWSIPKGEFNEEEDPKMAAMREFEEETGKNPSGHFYKLTPVIQKNGKKVHCWAFEGDIDLSIVRSNLFEMEWPPKSGKKQSFPEIDKGGWFTLEEAKTVINPRQFALLAEAAALPRAVT